MSELAQFIPLLVLLAVAASVAALVRRRRPPLPQGVMAGFRGWLLLLAVGQTLAPFRVASGLSQSFKDLDALAPLPNGTAVFYAELAANVLLLLFTALVTLAMWRRWPSFPRLFVWQWLAALALGFVEPGLVAVALGVPAAQMYSDPEIVRGMAQAAVAGLWVLYVRKSVRVRNTFGGAAARPADTARVFE